MPRSSFYAANPDARRTITVTGTASHEYGPTQATVTVPIEVTGTDRARTWSEFQTRLRLLEEAVSPKGNLTERHPRETKGETTKALRTVETTTLAASIRVTFDPQFAGTIFKSIVEAGLTFRDLSFGFISDPTSDPDHLGAAAADARRRAEAVAAGLGCRILGVHTVSTENSASSIKHKRQPFWLSSILGSDTDLRMRHSVEDPYDLDEDLFEFDDGSIPVRIVTAEVEVEFDIDFDIDVAA